VEKLREKSGQIERFSQNNLETFYYDTLFLAIFYRKISIKIFPIILEKSPFLAPLSTDANLHQLKLIFTQTAFTAKKLRKLLWKNSRVEMVYSVFWL